MSFAIKILLAIAVLAVFITWICHRGGERLRSACPGYRKDDGRPRPSVAQWDDEDEPPEAA